MRRRLACEGFGALHDGTQRVRAFRILPLVAVVLASIGCAPPVQQRVAPYPAAGQSASQGQTDSMDCEAWARANAGSAGDAALAGGAGGAVAGAAVGAAIGAIAGSFFGAADTGAALGAALGGARGGLQGAAGGANAQDQRYVTAYQNCMAARAYVVNGTAVIPVAQPQSTIGSSSGSAQPTVEDRLVRLRDLRRQGLINEKEYR